MQYLYIFLQSLRNNFCCFFQDHDFKICYDDIKGFYLLRLLGFLFFFLS